MRILRMQDWGRNKAAVVLLSQTLGTFQAVHFTVLASERWLIGRPVRPLHPIT